ncbi:MAG: ABC transporter permease [Thermomicrobiales bacterium]|nr:ABC transporter permease [Thermomicrobiales bacterium]
MDGIIDFFDLNLFKAVLRMATPLVFAAMGGLLSERSGIMNIALEGLMLSGAFAAVVGTYYLHNPWWGLLVALIVGGLTALIHAFWSIGLRSDQIVTGTAINLLAAGTTVFLIQRIWAQSGRTPTVQKLPDVAAQVNVLVPIAFLCVPIVYFFLKSSKLGLRVMACGEHPQAAESVGINVSLLRYGMVMMSGVFAAAAGAFLTIGSLGLFTRDMTAGRGFIALAAVIFGNWMPFGTLAACILFAGAQAFQIQAQTKGIGISADLLLALPYVLTIIAIAGVVRGSRAPAGLGQHPTPN